MTIPTRTPPRPRRLPLPHSSMLGWLLLASAILAGSAPLHAAEQAAEPAGPALADWILQKLARPAPMRTAFVELRGSALLKTPLRIEGEYRRPRDAVLVREVRAPYAETTTIGQGQVTIARAGRAPRTFSLARAPELAGLQASFGALLGGDRAGLQQHYRLAAEGTRQHWILRLIPKQAELAATMQGITLYGRGAELRCIETMPAVSGERGSVAGTSAAGKPGEVQRTLLAGAARDAGALSDAAALAALCHGKPAP